MVNENRDELRLADLDKLREKNSVDSAELIKSLKAQIGELKAELSAKDDEIRRIKVNAAVDAALLAAGARNIVAVKALITETDEMQLSKDGYVKGLAEKIDALKKSDGYLFEQRGSKLTIRGAKPGESGYDGLDGAVDISKMTYSQLTDYIKKNPSAKIFD